MVKGDNHNTNDEQIGTGCITFKGCSGTPGSPASIVAQKCHAANFTLQLEVQSDKVFEWVLKDIHNWMHGMVHVTRNQPVPTYRSLEMYQTFTLAMELFTLNLVQLAGKTLQMLFIQLESVLEEPSFNLLWNILDMVYEMKMNGQIRLLNIFIQHLQALTQV